MESAPLKPPMSPHAGVTYAGFWRRFAAHIIDKMLIGILGLIVFIMLVVMLGISVFSYHDVDPTDVGFLLALIGAYFMIILLLFIADWLYFAIMETTKGATVGKMALGIKVTDMEGNPISFGRASGRYFAKIISGLTFCIGFIIAGFTQQKQALHDIIARTLVVNKY